MRTDRAYKKVSERNNEEIPENEIRVSANKRTHNYFVRAAILLLEMKHKSITLKATGRAIPTALTCAETLKRRIKGIHQLNEITNT